MADPARYVSLAQAPAHPVPQLQGPFEESMIESVQDDPDADIYLDPVVRRNTLLEAPTYVRVVAGRWKQKPGERFHPLWKLIAQISFGVHLLAEGMAKSEDEVMQILQAHVDEIDGFLERTTEDFDLAQDDIQERLRCLKLPLSHPATFDKMLEDRNFRLSIVEGNEKIEHIVDRTTQAMKDSLKDVQKGFDSTSCLEAYLRKLDTIWIRQSVEHEAVFVAMLGNVEGWRKAFMALHLQGGKLSVSLKKLTDIINEMQARAGEVSRRLLHQARGYNHGNDARSHHSQLAGKSIPGRSTPVSRFQTLPSKQLPGMPDRPPLRQAVSDDLVSSQPSIRMTHSQQSMRKTSGSRSSTPQNGAPTARQVKTVMSPKLIQIPSTSSTRIQSITPSLVEATTSGQITPKNITPPIGSTSMDEDDEPDRYFPPVELPAHVPEETMRHAPMSKQNRLSLGLGLVSGNRSDKRTSRLGAPAAALVDLLCNPTSHRSSIISQVAIPAEKLHTPRQYSITDTNNSDPVASVVQASVARSPSVSESNSSFTKNNVRRPKKGAQHWFDAHDDDLDDDDKFPVQEDSTPQAAPVIRQTVVKALVNTDNLPGTPSWAVKSFVQADRRREELKAGTFGSHPPDLPLGSPPLTEGKLPDPLSVAPPKRSPSHSSSTGTLGTLGEPGPAVTPSEAGSVKKDDPAWKRASAAAPEVVLAHSLPPMPSPPKQFLAEMQGCTPESDRAKDPPVIMRANIVELEAPQQYFQLPPITETTVVTKSPPLLELADNYRVSEECGSPYRQYFKLPSRDSAVKISTLPPEFYVEKSAPLATVAESMPAADAEENETILPTDETETEAKGSVSEKVPAMETVQSIEEKRLGAIIHIEAPDPVDRSSKTSQISVSQIPLPPSPLEEEKMEVANEKKQPETRDTLFLLPAVAYRAPSSPKPTLEPLQTQLRAVSYIPPARKVQTHSPSVRDSQTSSTKESSSTRESSSSLSPHEAQRPSPKLEEPETIPEEPSTTRKPRQMQRDHKPSDLRHRRNSSSHGSQNGWKAFFTGQPSPVGSNLSIRSIKRESVLEQRSPTLLSPASASHRFPSSPAASSVKDMAWFHRPLEESKPAVDGASGLSASEKIKGAKGLGITVSGH